jgi:hypothetical protein
MNALLAALWSSLLSWITGEIAELWKDGTIKEIAKDAVEWAEGKFTNNEEKCDKASDRIVEKAKETGMEVGKEAAIMIVEKAVQRYLKS